MYSGNCYQDTSNPTGSYFDGYGTLCISMSVASCNVDDRRPIDFIYNDNAQHWLGFLLNPLYRVFKPVFRLICRSNGIRASP